MNLKKTIDCRDIISNQFTLEWTKISGMEISLASEHLGSHHRYQPGIVYKLIDGYVRYTQEIQKKKLVATIS